MTSMWDPYEPAELSEPLATLQEAGEFVLVDASIRLGVSTQYGPRDAVDLVVQTTDKETQRRFSGFTAGIVGQVKRAGDRDLPALCKIEPAKTAKGETKQLALVKKIEPGVELDTIAAGLATPIQPISTNGAGDDIPY